MASSVIDHHLNLSFLLCAASIFSYTQQRWRLTHLFVALSHSQLALCLAVLGSASVSLSHHLYAMPPYPFLAADYPSSLCLFCHHQWIGASFLVGSGAHSSIFIIRAPTSTAGIGIYAARSGGSLSLAHRGLQLGHLIYISVYLGLHAFGLFIHNDTIQCLGRRDECWSDFSLNLRPVFAIMVQSLASLRFSNELVDGRVVRSGQNLGSSDWLVHHIHAFTLTQLLWSYTSLWHMLEAQDCCQISLRLDFATLAMDLVEEELARSHHLIIFS
jgi:hypothetical protein